MKERDFYRAKLDEANGRIRSLEHDLAELQARDKTLTERVKHMASNPPRKPRSRYARH
jgi:predicted  nucleic acid-binding Zn-ribbon protein